MYGRRFACIRSFENNVNTLTSKINNLEVHEEFLQRQVAVLTLTQRTELEILTKLQKGELNARLIDRDVLSTLKHDIHTHNENFEIPLREENFRPAEIIKISHVDATIYNDIVIIVLTGIIFVSGTHLKSCNLVITPNVYDDWTVRWRKKIKKLR